MQAQVYKIALIGCGRIAEKHLKAINFQERKGRARLVAVADGNLSVAKANVNKFYKRPGQVNFYESLSQVLASEDVDIVAITTPSGSHKILSLEAIQAGKHLLVEKPLAMTYQDTLEIQELVERAGVKLALGHIYRYFPVMQNLQEHLSQGKFGKVLYGSVDVRWGHDQAYYDYSPWRGTRDADGGVIMNQSVHALDLMRWLLGAEGSEIEACKGFAATQNHIMESEDLGLGLYQFSNGTFLNYEGSTSTEPDHHEANFFLACEQADIRAGIKKSKPFISIQMEGKDIGKQYLWDFIKEQIRAEGISSLKTLFNPHTAIYSDLIFAIRDNKSTVANINSGVSSLEMVNALYKATGII